MEFCMGLELALKSSLRREFSMKSTHQQAVLFDDLSWCAAGVACDDFSVDDLLDFSNGEFEELEDEKDSLSVSSQDRVDDDNNSNSSSFSSDQSLITDELVEPVDEIAELEWVSRFVDDSSRSELSLMYPNYGEYRFEPELKPVLSQTPCFPLSFPSKARTKRTRPAPISRFWPLGSSSNTDSPISSSSSSESTITSSVQNMESCYSFIETEPEAKRQKKKPAVQNGGLFQRKCTHCQTQKTPQWRTGPLGPKTLCNACGVRYKSGRLFPEYRPACSPTFSVDVHSNSHRKVLEMRKKKEMAGPEVGLTHMVHSF